MNYLELTISGSGKVFALGFAPIPDIGWGVMALNVILQLARLPDRTLAVLVPFRLDEFPNPLHRRQLEPVLALHRELSRVFAQHPDQPFLVQGAVLHGLTRGVVEPDFGIQMTAPRTRLRGRPNLAITFQENTRFQSDTLEHARLFDCILAGSTWSAQLLRSEGLAHVVPLLQGIDPTLFHPAPRTGLLPGRFVIFSGGKLEYRKGQDLVVAAFKAFHARHRDAFLLTAWQNYLPVFMAGLEKTGHVQGLPELDGERTLHIQPWLARNGIAPHDCFDIGRVPNHLMPQVLREADAALFCSRCEGGTNMVAMECLACGVPTILSANTGHLDLVGPDRCYPLSVQGPVQPTEVYPGVEGWGESSVEEIVETLEAVYADRTAASCRGQAAVRFMQDWTWEKQVQRLLTQADTVGKQVF